MATQTGNIYISESMINIIEIPTANLGFRQSDMAVEIGNSLKLYR